MKGKYSSELAERLDRIEPDDQYGDVDGLGWVGWYAAESVALFNDSEGFVDAVEGIDRAHWEELLQGMCDREDSEGV